MRFQYTRRTLSQGNKQSGKYVKGLCPNFFIFQGKIRQLTLIIMQLGNPKIAFSLNARSPNQEIEKVVNRSLSSVF